MGGRGDVNVCVPPCSMLVFLEAAPEVKPYISTLINRGVSFHPIVLCASVSQRLVPCLISFPNGVCGPEKNGYMLSLRARNLHSHFNLDLTARGHPKSSQVL